jgi:hypothetical protein
MGAGMAEFVEREDCETREQYDLYCHYVAGLVGIGLSQLFGEWGVGRLADCEPRTPLRLTAWSGISCKACWGCGLGVVWGRGAVPEAALAAVDSLGGWAATAGDQGVLWCQPSLA